MKKLLLVLLVLLLLSPAVLAWNGYFAADYDLQDDITLTLHLQKHVFMGLHWGTTLKMLPEDEGWLPSGLNYEIWLGLQVRSWSLKFSRMDTFPAKGSYAYVLRLRYDF